MKSHLLVMIKKTNATEIKTRKSKYKKIIKVKVD